MSDILNDEQKIVENNEKELQRFQEVMSEFQLLNKNIENGIYSESSDEELNELYDKLVELENEIDSLIKKLQINL